MRRLDAAATVKRERERTFGGNVGIEFKLASTFDPNLNRKWNE
jgi:hypothetical protein